MPVPRALHRQATASHPLKGGLNGYHTRATTGSERPRLQSAPEYAAGAKREAPKPIPASGPISAFSDVELLASFVRAGNEAAFSELYGRHKSEIYTYCLRMMAGDADRANDVFQDVFIKAFEKANQFRDGSNVVGWIYTIARNMCLNYIRNDRPYDTLEKLASTESNDRSLAPEYDEEQHFLRQKIEEALRLLPVEFREPFMLREFDGFTYNEIALMTGTTLGITKVRIYRAKQRMRELLSPHLAE